MQVLKSGKFLNSVHSLSYRIFHYLFSRQSDKIIEQQDGLGWDGH